MGYVHVAVPVATFQLSNVVPHPPPPIFQYSPPLLLRLMRICTCDSAATTLAGKSAAVPPIVGKVLLGPRKSPAVGTVITGAVVSRSNRKVTVEPPTSWLVARSRARTLSVYVRPLTHAPGKVASV